MLTRISGNEVHICCSDYGLSFRHFFRTYLPDDISLLAVVWLSALPLIPPCCTLWSVRFRAYSPVPDKESSISLMGGFKPPSDYQFKLLTVFSPSSLGSLYFSS
ncbi:MAG: hypothetical protein WBM44_24275, partial [Waterburya sp.]